MSTVIKTMYTEDLGRFKNPEVNRDINNPESQNRIKRIAESMVNDGLLLHPIVVTSSNYIVDGKHRVEAAKLAGKGIYFIVDESIPNSSKSIFDAAKKFNLDSKEWTKKDYLRGHSARGIESYVLLDKFTKKYPMFTLTEQLMLVNNSGTKHANKRAFANGEFIVEEERLKTAKEWAENILELKPYFKDYNKSVFVRALLTIMEKQDKFSFEDFMKRVKMKPDLMKHKEDKRSYAKMIEHVYNYRRKNKVKLPASAKEM